MQFGMSMVTWRASKGSILIPSFLLMTSYTSTPYLHTAIEHLSRCLSSHCMINSLFHWDLRGSKFCEWFTFNPRFYSRFYSWFFFSIINPCEVFFFVSNVITWFKGWNKYCTDVLLRLSCSYAMNKIMSLITNCMQVVFSLHLPMSQFLLLPMPLL